MGNDENNFRSSDAFFDGVNFIRTPKSSKKQAPKQPIQNERSEDQEEIASEVMDKYHKEEDKNKSKKVSKEKRVKPAKAQRKKKNGKLHIVIAAALLLTGAVLTVGGLHLKKFRPNEVKPKVAASDKLNELASNQEELEGLIKRIQEIGTDRNGKETDLSTLQTEQKVESDEILEQLSGNVTKTVAQILKDKDGNCYTHLKKTTKTAYGKTISEKNIYLDSKGDVITAFQYDFDQKGIPTFSTSVEYDENMFAYAKKAAATAGKDMALDAINLSLLASEDTLPEEFKDELGKNNVGVTIKNEPNFKSEAGVSIVGGSEKTLETSLSYDIIVNDAKTKDPVFLGGSTVSFDLNGFTHADFYISTNPFNNKGFNVNAGLSADQNGGVQFSVGGAYNTAGQATLNKPTYINYQVNNL